MPVDDQEYTEQLERLDEDEIYEAVKEEINAAYDDNDDERIDEALDYYEARLPMPMVCEDEEESPFSEFVSPDIRNAVEDTLADILPGFYGDVPVMFSPMGPTDEQQATEESYIVNHVVMTANKGHSLLNRAFKDALINGNGVVKVHMNESHRFVGRRLKGVSPDVLPMIQHQVTGIEQNDDGTLTVDIRKSEGRNFPTAEWVPVDQLLVNSDHDEVSFNNARFVCHRRNISAASLVSSGVPKDVVDDLAYNDAVTHDAYLRRKRNTYRDTGHKSNRNIVVAESYYQIDTDGDGIAELIRVVTAGGSNGDQKLLWMEPWNEQPFASGVPFYSPRGWRGVSLTERLKFVQDYKSDMFRQIIDTGWRNLVQRLVVMERMVNMSDVLHSRRGGIIRVKDPTAVNILEEARLPGQVFGIMEQLNLMRKESGGQSIDMAAESQQLGADSAHGIERIMSAIEETNAMVAKNLAETLVSEIYQKMHRNLRLYWPGVINARVDGTWLSQVPSEWAERHDVGIAVGLSTGTRMRQAASLAQIIQQQGMDMQMGMDGVMVSPKNMYNARVEFTRLSGARYPDKYWVDPESQQGQQAAQQKAQAAQQQAQAAQQAAQQQMDLMRNIEEIKANTDMAVAQIKAQTDQYKDNLQHVQKTVDQRLKLIEMNAQFDKEPVPDNMNGGNNAKPQ